MFGADLTPKEAIPLPGSRPASFASASDRSQSALPAEKANLWKAATRKPMLLFLLFGLFLLRMDTRALS